MRYFILIIAVATLVGCGETWNASSNRYQIVASSDGRVYRLDVKTGEVTAIEQGAMHKLSQAEQTPLIVGTLI